VHEEHITRLNDVRELIDILIRLVGAFRYPGAINQPPRNHRLDNSVARKRYGLEQSTINAETRGLTHQAIW